MNLITGIHHVTAGVAGAQEDVDFLTNVVGQRMIKQTVLFDGTTPIYHLYYANKNAEIGTVWTSFPFKQAGVYGRRGSGQVDVTSYSVDENSLDFWAKHLAKNNTKPTKIMRRFGRDVIQFEHPSGLGFEVIGDNRDKRAGWVTADIEEKNAVRGFNSVVMSVREITEQDIFLRQALGFRKVNEDGAYHLYEVADGGPGNQVILRHEPNRPQGSWILGSGTVHHVAFQVANDEKQAEVKAYLEGLGYTDTSEQKDRNYFHSIYVRSPGGILCEVATCDIGFAVDEPADELGQHLLLPPWFEPRRDEIVAPLEKITPPPARPVVMTK